MGFFKKLASIFSRPSASTGREALWIAVRCRRCGEVIRARVNLFNDLSAEYTDGATQYICRKELVGGGTPERPCFQRIAVMLSFDERRRLIAHEVSGGEFVDE